jgi:hypothetical protein
VSTGHGPWCPPLNRKPRHPERSNILAAAIHEIVVIRTYDGAVEYEGELYAERLRRKAQAAAVADGTSVWQEKVDHLARVKLASLWDESVENLSRYEGAEVLQQIGRRSVKSIGIELSPQVMTSAKAADELLLSLLEAEHEALTTLARATSSGGYRPGAGPEAFRVAVNQVLQAHLVELQLHQNSRLVPVRSQEMHDSVVEPTLYLLHSQRRFAGAEKAYQDALKELRNRAPDDAITDAGTALQEALTALGCEGKTLGDQLKSAKNAKLIRDSDTPLTAAIVNWVATQRNRGEAHKAEHGFDMSDGWMVVHVVGALIIRLSESKPE